MDRGSEESLGQAREAQGEAEGRNEEGWGADEGEKPRKEAKHNDMKSPVLRQQLGAVQQLGKSIKAGWSVYIHLYVR
jgi:hypothetical protein